MYLMKVLSENAIIMIKYSLTDIHMYSSVAEKRKLGARRSAKWKTNCSIASIGRTPRITRIRTTARKPVRRKIPHLK